MPSESPFGFESLLVALVLSLPRVLACIVMAPVFPSSIMPRTVRVAISLGFALPAMAGVMYSIDQAGTPTGLVALLLKEAAVGVMLGFVIAAPFWAVEGVGAMFDQQRGANYSEMVTPFAQSDQSVLGSTLRMGLTVLLMTTGGLALMYDLMLRSFEAWPILSLTPRSPFFSMDNFIASFSGMAEQALLYAVPILAIMLLVDFAFGILGIFAPQLPLFFASMPVKSIIGMFVLFLYAAILLHNAADYAVGHLSAQLSTMLR
jgi:type III secretion protein T